MGINRSEAEMTVQRSRVELQQHWIAPVVLLFRGWMLLLAASDLVIPVRWEDLSISSETEMDEVIS